MTEDERRFIDRRSQSQFEHCPRYDKHELSEEQILQIAKKAVEMARDGFYREVGQSVVSRFFWMIGSITVAIFSILHYKDYFDK